MRGQGEEALHGHGDGDVMRGSFPGRQEGKKKLPGTRDQRRKDKVQAIENGLCVLCGDGAGDHRNIPCPAAAVERLKKPKDNCPECGSRTPSTFQPCETCSRVSDGIAEWTKLMIDLLWKVQRFRSEGSRERGFKIVKHERCRACKQVDWASESGRHGALTWVCKAVPICKRCEGRGITGKTPEERVAQRLGDFGKCPDCMGRTPGPCGMRVDARDFMRGLR